MSLAPVSPPPLRDGDRLTADEFLRRWEAMPDLKHAELIDGIVYMPSPVSFDHSEYHFMICYWLAMYQEATPGIVATLDMTWLMGDRQVPQPDLTLLIPRERGGQSQRQGKYCKGAPELIAEVSESSRSRDLGVKLRMYQQVGVREYLVVLPSDGKLIWHQWTADGYERREPDADGILRSRILPGLWLDVEALLRVDRPHMRRVLEQGLASLEHAEFVARLNPPGGGSSESIG